jgi:hypothetical protein
MGTLSAELRRLEEAGCYPSIYCCGPRIWRAHINVTGKHWGEGITPLIALQEAIEAWEQGGRKMDGMAD